MVLTAIRGAQLSVFVVTLSAHSFAMHQIRKIMSLSLAVLRGHVPEWVVDVALASNFLIHIPLAPSEALCLVVAPSSAPCFRLGCTLHTQSEAKTARNAVLRRGCALVEGVLRCRSG